jgi:RNA polymerase sigma-70 factor (family 1)
MKKDLEFDEREITKLLAAGSELAFTKIFDRYEAKLYHTAYRVLKSRPLAEEIVQEVFLKLWTRRIALPEFRSLEAFLYTMTKNLTIDMLRKRKVEVTVAYKWQAKRKLVDNVLENAVADAEYEQLLKQAINRLTPQQKQVYELSRIEGLSHQDIANRLNISSKRVNNIISEAVSYIHKDLKPHIGYTFLPLLLQIFNGQ